MKLRGLLALAAGLVASAPPFLGQPAQDLVEVVKVVDGDTLHVSRNGEVAKLRLLSVDTEEKISGRPATSPSKPETVFGHETTLWAQSLFTALADEDGVTRVGLRFPDEREELDAYGRLLCHVVLPDGRDFNLLLVELGKSPYFNKYGNSRIAHADFVRFQAEAQEKQLGIWNPRTNRAQTKGAPEARRPYDRLLPWWQARADAIEELRRRHADEPERILSAEASEDLEDALSHGREVEVFGAIDRFYEERDGSLTVRFRSGELQLRATLPKAERRGVLEERLRASTEEFRQNFLYVRGPITCDTRGLRVVPDGPEAWRSAIKER